MERLLRDHPNDGESLWRLRRALMEVSSAEWGLNRKADAIASCERAQDVSEALATYHPNEYRNVDALSQTSARLCHLYYTVGDVSSAARAMGRAIEATESLARRYPGAVAVETMLSEWLDQQVTLSRRLGRLDEATAAAERLVELRGSLARSASVPDEARGLWIIAQQVLAICYVDCGRVAEATSLTMRIEAAAAALKGPHPVNMVYDLGCVYSRLGAIRPRSGEEGFDPTPEVRRVWLERAVEQLHKLAAMGYVDVNYIERDDDFQPLRDREDYRQILMDMRMPVDPFSKAGIPR
jgi:hypothetical protein